MICAEILIFIFLTHFKMYTKPFLNDDEYMTPKSAWESVAHLVPKDKVVYEVF